MTDLKALEFCQLSYSGKYPKIEQSYSVKGVQMYHINYYGTHYLVFRGTDEPRDWLRNLNFATNFHGFHLGFARGAASLSHVIKKIQSTAMEEGAEIIFTGHSLGGAIATIAFISSPYYHNASLVTFGSPKVNLKREIKEGFHYQNNQDLVPTLPPRYKGFKNAIWLDYNGEHITTPNWGTRAYNRLKSVFRAWSKFQLFDMWYDHDLKRYEKALKRYKSRFFI